MNRLVSLDRIISGSSLDSQRPRVDRQRPWLIEVSDPLCKSYMLSPTWLTEPKPLPHATWIFIETGKLGEVTRLSGDNFPLSSGLPSLFCSKKGEGRAGLMPRPGAGSQPRGCWALLTGSHLRGSRGHWGHTIAREANHTPVHPELRLTARQTQGRAEISQAKQSWWDAVRSVLACLPSPSSRQGVPPARGCSHWSGPRFSGQQDHTRPLESWSACLACLKGPGLWCKEPRSVPCHCPPLRAFIPQPGVWTLHDAQA